MAKKTNWTEEQLEAITQQDCSLLVAAAAGSGKTAVLVERIIRKITDPKHPVDIDKLLIVTFTNAAAAEMRERIAQAISAVLEANPHSRKLQRQLTLLNKASITTLHSFFLEVIRSNFQLIDIDPGFRIADETEAALMQIEVLNELFEDQYEQEEANQDFYHLLECYGGNRDDQGLQNMVLNLYSFVQSIPWPERWLEKMIEGFNVEPGADFGATPWGQVLLQSALVELEGLREMLGRAVVILEGEPGLEKYREVFLDDLYRLEAVIKIAAKRAVTTAVKGAATTSVKTPAPSRGIPGVSDWDGICSAIRDFSFKRLSPAGKEADKVKQEHVKKIRDEVKKGIKKLQERTFTAFSREINQDLRTVYPAMQTLGRLTRDFAARYAARKRQKSLVDFNDLEHFCLEILTERDENGVITPSQAALAYREKFEEILVDEYQDSNLVQEIMIKMISREDSGTPNVFMVGDVKQSIYRFRHARPELFLEKYRDYSLDKNNPFRKILLFKNFRSRREIVAAVNFIFKQIMSRAVGELEYTDAEALNPGADYPDYDGERFTAGGETELHLIQTGDNRDAIADEEDSLSTGQGPGEESAAGEEAWEEDMPDSVQCEARLAARRIQQLLQPDEQGRYFCIFDKELKEYRGLEYRDIVILLRTTKNWSDVFMEELRQLGIPAFADTGTGFFKTSEVQVILSLLQVIDNPLQDIPLLSVLRSPIVGFTTDELAELRLADRKGDIYHALCALAQGAGYGAHDSKCSAEEDSRDAAGAELVGQDYGWACPGNRDFPSVGPGNLASGLTDLEGPASSGMASVRDDWDSANTGSQASRKAAAFLSQLEKWRRMSLYMSTDQLLWRLYNETGYYAMVGAMPAGEQRQANLRILYERARQFEATSYKGLFNFIYFIDKLKSSHGDMGSARILGENDNVVRIMSIHKSKGLEFPVVFLCGCGKQFNLQDTRKSVLFHQDLGFGPDVVHPQRRLRYPSVPKQAVREKIMTESLSEEMRILYVAMTRAREKLIITGAVSDIKKAARKWAGCANSQGEKLPVYQVHQACTFLDWIGPALMRNESCQLLREAVDLTDSNCLLKHDPSLWSIFFWDKDQVLNRTADEAAAAGDFIEPENYDSGIESTVGQVYSEEIRRRLEWEYPYLLAARVPAMISVTELKRRFEVQMREHTVEKVEGDERMGAVAGSLQKLIKKPLFLQEQKGLSGAEAGTAMHFVMQHLEFARRDFEKQIEEMVAKDLLTQQQADSLDTAKIRQFLASPLGTRMMASKKVYREVPFQMELPCWELYPEMETDLFAGETVLLQGVIDCFFEEENGIVLLDYKTDYVPEGGAESIKERYRVQIAYYARALELLTGKKVKGKYIYLFYTGEALEY